ncbi:MAG: hypothetical protein ACI87O_002539, partial [Planctomycetota bacterium]
MRSKRAFRGIAALVSISLLSGCGGGGGGGSSTPALTAPADGSVLGGAQTITWVSPSGRDTVDILLSTDGGVTFPTVLAATEPDTGLFLWDTTTGGDGDQYRIQITPTNTSATVLASFGSAANFTVDNTIPAITLVSPQAGSVFGGVQAKILWSTVDANPGTVAIDLSSDGGGTYPTQLAVLAQDSGQFLFDATGLAEGMTYRIRVTPTDLAGNVGVSDESAGDAEIDNTPPTINLTSPVGGESWSAAQDVTYTMVDNNPGQVEIFLSSDSGLTYPTTLTLVATAAGPYSWNTGLDADGSAYRIRVVGVDEAGNRSTPSDSPADFSLENIILNQNALFLDTNTNGVLDAG